ncbi:hypothetical protein SLEP1_g54931 [Rubroshorea leprosula]|uniref:Uncharacterized protein n=1 Tax=Rubroshorea leprosula TaxID=152421 RepID=A0AAV5ME70_9ROSI|nr:hypothetical protein SLEP1_g54931 [Rubroshorea leprosula]
MKVEGLNRGYNQKNNNNRTKLQLTALLYSPILLLHRLVAGLPNSTGLLACCKYPLVQSSPFTEKSLVSSDSRLLLLRCSLSQFRFFSFYPNSTALSPIPVFLQRTAITHGCSLILDSDMQDFSKPTLNYASA